MRRLIAGFLAFLGATASLLVLPVYAAPGPEAHPVPTSIDEVALGSVTEPEGDAVVALDGEALPGGVDDPAPQASGEAQPSAAPESTEPAPSAAPQPTGASGPTTATGSATDPSTTGEGDAVVTGDEVPGIPALTISRPDTDRFDSIGITWQEDPAVVDVVATIRLRSADGTWGDWTALEPDDVEQSVTPGTADHDVRGGTAPYWTGGSYGVEAVVQATDGSTPADVRLTLLDPGSSPADDLAAATPAATAHAASAMPTVVTRAQWGADESIRTWDPEYAPTIKAATIHHTADSNDYTADQVPAIMRSIYAYHAQSRGWGDIGYNVIVDKFGRIYEGRFGGLASTVIGAHAGGFNNSTFGVSMLGNYDVVPVPQATVNAVSEIIAWKFSLYGVDPRGSTVLTSAGGGTSRYAAGVPVGLPTIFGHRDVGSTACPGRYGYARLDEIRTLVTQAMPRYAKMSTVVTNSATGGIPDVSPVVVSAGTAANGMSTVFVRGMGNTIWYRTSKPGGGWTSYQGVPATGATAGPSVTVTDGNRVHLVVRGTDASVWYNSAPLGSDGTPGAWDGWQPLGGLATTAPTIAALSSTSLSVVTRGTDGGVYQRVLSGGTWSPWAGLGGYAYSTPVVQAESQYNRFLVSVVGTDNHVWQVGTSVTSAGAAGPWVGGGLYTSLMPGTNGSSATAGPATIMSVGSSDYTPVLLDYANGVTVPLTGATVTSVAALAPQPDGATLVLGRGTDNALWVMTYRSGRAGAWTSLGGTLP